MITELLRWLLTPASLGARRLGHATESVSIHARHHRCRAAWQPHLDASRKAVLDAARDLPQRRTALILGSGHLLDLPLEVLAHDFARVMLVDVVHPFAARRARRHYDNVELVEWDVTGLADAQRADGAWMPERIVRFHDRDDIDLCVSLNLLSQLPLAPCRHLRERGAGEDETAARARHRPPAPRLPRRIPRSRLPRLRPRTHHPHARRHRATP